MPLLNDETGQLMYGVHPYFFSNGQSWWDQHWGYLTSTAPVIATEWNYQAGLPAARQIPLWRRIC